MLFGKNFAGHIRTQNNQWVETRIVSFIIPFQIPYSFFVIGVERGKGRNWKTGLELKLIRPSVFALFLRAIIHIVTVGAIILALIHPPLLIISFLALTAWVYICFIFGKTPANEMLIREAMFRTTGYSVMPEWLKEEDVNRFHQITEVLYNRFVKDKTHTYLPAEEAYIALAYKVMERRRYGNASYDTSIHQLEKLVKPHFSFNKNLHERGNSPTGMKTYFQRK